MVFKIYGSGYPQVYIGINISYSQVINYELQDTFKNRHNFKTSHRFNLHVNIQSHTARHMKLFLETNNNEINVSHGINVDHKKNSK